MMLTAKLHEPASVFQVTVQDNRMEICYRRRNWLHLLVCGAMFVPFAAIGALALAGFVEKHDWFALVVGLPFATMALLMGMTIVLLLIGEERLCMDGHVCAYALHAVVRWKRQRVPLAELKRAVADFSRADREPELELRTLGRSIRFGRGADVEALKRLARVINDFLDDLRRELDDGTPEIFTKPPAGSTLRVEPARDELRIRHRGRWSSTRLFEFAVVAMFVGGIVGVATMVLIRQQRPLELVLLTPFYIMAALPAIALLRAISAPAFSTEWRLSRQELRWCRRLLGVGVWRTLGLPALESAEVRWRSRSRLRALLAKVRFDGGSSMFTSPEDGTHLLALVDIGGRDVATLGGLSEGEARWLKDLLHRDYADWFVRP